VNERIDRWTDRKGKIVIKRDKRPEYGTRLRIEIDDENSGCAIRKVLNRYSFENDGEGLWWKEHIELYQQIDEILRPDGLTSEKLDHTKAVLTRRAIDKLIALSDRIEPIRRDAIHWQFSASDRVARTDRVDVAKWLLRNFEVGWHQDDQLSTRLYDYACAQIADDLIRFILDGKYRDERWPLALGLARTKHPRAANVIVTLLGQGANRRGALEALGKLPAQKYIDKIRKYLRDNDGEVRRQAKKTLQKLGVAVERPPPPVHLVKNRKPIPKGLQEWSTNLEMDDLAPMLKKVARCVDEGFGNPQIAEVLGIAEEMLAEQTRRFHFPIVASRKPSALWIVIFMDDIDSPDIEVRADAQIVGKLERLVPVA
jgi:hypothetical protein